MASPSPAAYVERLAQGIRSGDRTVLSRAITELGIYPAVDPLASSSRILDAQYIGDRHYQVATEVRNRFEGMVDRFSFYAPYKVDPEVWKDVRAGFHG